MGMGGATCALISRRRGGGVPARVCWGRTSSFRFHLPALVGVQPFSRWRGLWGRFLDRRGIETRKMRVGT